jgi:hypothetical protein
MLAIFEVQGAASGGRKIWLASGQSVRVGRTEEADVALPMDKNLASIHFMLTCANSQCSAKAAGGNTLCLNGRGIQESVLRTGDVLQAGGTRFVVTIEGVADASDVGPEAAGEKRTPDPQPGMQTSVRCKLERTPAGAYLYRFAGNAQAAHAILIGLKASGFVHAIVDRQSSWLQPQRSRATLFDWLSDRMTDASPDVVLDLHPGKDTMTEQAIADRETTFVVAPVMDGQLLEHLRLAARGQVAPDEQPDAERMLLSFDGARLDDVLPKCDRDYAEFLFSKLTAVFYWSDNHQAWTIVSATRLDDTLCGVTQAAIDDHLLPGELSLAATALPVLTSPDGETRESSGTLIDGMEYSDV